MDPTTIQLPVDPLPGEIFMAPEDTEIGSSTHLRLLRDDTAIGYTDGTGKIENVSRKWQLARTHTHEPLIPDTPLRVIAVTRKITSLVFVEYFGWLPHKYGKEEITSNQLFNIDHGVLLFNAPNVYIYETVKLTAKGDLE